MSWLWVFTIISAILLVIFITLLIIAIKLHIEPLYIISGACCLMFGIVMFIFLCLAISTPIRVKQEMVRYEKERQQIEYQIENLTDDAYNY